MGQRLVRTMVAAIVLCRSSAALRATPALARNHALLRHGVARAPRAWMAAAAADAPAMPTMDERLVGEDPELVKKSLLKRRAGEAQLEAVDRIAELTKERAEFAQKGMKAREERKKLSQEIGKLMKAGGGPEVDAIKEKVAACAVTSDTADERIDAIESERTTLFNTLPNLLDPRVPEGDDEEANEEVSSWGVEGVELESGKLWHDEIGNKLGGIDLESVTRRRFPTCGAGGEALCNQRNGHVTVMRRSRNGRRRQSSPARASPCCAAPSRGSSVR